MNDLCCFVEVGFAVLNGHPVNQERSSQAFSQFLIVIMHCVYNDIASMNE